MEFGRLRAFFWPIHRQELRQYLPIFVVTLLLGINYHILRNLKYSLLVLAPDAGAEAIPFVQLWGLAPAALVMTYLLSRLCRRLTEGQVFYATVMGFLIFFALFTYVLYPLREQLEPKGAVIWMQSHLSPRLSGFIAIIRHWPLSLFYVASELWKVSVLAVLFWGFVNAKVRFSQAQRFYGPLVLATSLAGIAGGSINRFFPKWHWVQNIGTGVDPWHRSITAMMLVVIGVGLLAMFVFRYLERHSPRELVDGGQEGARRSWNFSVKEALRCLSRSPYLLSLGFIVAAEYTAFSLAEIMWKDRLRIYFPDPGDFNAFTGSVVVWANILSVAVSALLSGGLINRLGWRVAAIIGPVILLATSVAFYLFVVFPEAPIMRQVASLFSGASPLAVAVFLGGVHNCLCRVAKTCLVDPTKELAFVPLDQSTKIQGKAIIDGIGVHAGRAGGALVQHILLIFVPTVAAGAPIAGVIVIAIGLLWMRSVSFVGKKYGEITRERAATAS